MYIPAADATIGEPQWRSFVTAQGFGHLVAAGVRRRVPVVAPTQFLLDGDEIVLHLAAPNPLLVAVTEDPWVLLSVAGDWAFIPSDWKAIADEDPRLGIPTTYYGAVQLTGHARVVEEPAAVAAVLRRQLAALQPGTDIADPEVAHSSKLRAIRGIVITVVDVRAKFKYGGNVDDAHRAAVVDRLEQRDRAGDRAAARRTNDVGS